MYQIVTQSDFIDAFRSLRPDNFTYEGLLALYDYLIEYEEGSGASYRMDVIALCCEFSEYESLEELNKDFSAPYASVDALRDVTIVIEVPGTGRLIVQGF